MRIKTQRETFAYRLAADDEESKKYLGLGTSPDSEVSTLEGDTDISKLNLPTGKSPTYKQRSNPPGYQLSRGRQPGFGAGGGSSAGSNGGSTKATGTPGGGAPSQNLTQALERAGIDPSMYPLISGFSAAEGNNPSGAPTLGFTDGQAGTTLDSHAQALAKQLQDRRSVAGDFPHGGSPADQASWMATVVGQTGNPSDWQGNAQPARSDYVNRIVQNMPSTPTPTPTPSAPTAMGPGQQR